MTAIEKIVNYTNAKLTEWYKNIKLDYNIDGKGSCIYNTKTDSIEIKAEENGETMFFSMPYYTNENFDFYFNVWMEEPNN